MKGIGKIVMAAVLAAAGIAAFFTLLSCGRYSYADVQGYVKDSGAGIGIVGATVDIYLSDPSAGGITPFASTSTSYNLQIPGWYTQRIMWYSETPQFDDQGDVKAIWLSVSHQDFAPSAPVSVAGVVSGTQNTVPDVLLSRGYFTGIVTGVVTSNPLSPTAGVNGTKVGLELDSTDTVENDDYVAYTTTSVSSSGSAATGTFTFPSVRWQKTAAASEVSDVKAVKLWITPPAGSGYSAKSVVVDINSGQIPNVLTVLLP